MSVTGTSVPKMTAIQATKLIDRTLKQIKERNLTIPRGWENRNAVQARMIVDRKTNPSMWLLRAVYELRFGWNNYRRTGGAYLAGSENGRDWAVRVPSTIRTVDQALHWITPEAVRKAQRAKQTVFRQGSIFFVPRRRGLNLGILKDTKHKVHFKNGEPVENNVGIKFSPIIEVVIDHPIHDTVVLDSREHGWTALVRRQLK